MKIDSVTNIDEEVMESLLTKQIDISDAAQVYAGRSYTKEQWKTFCDEYPKRVSSFRQQILTKFTVEEIEEHLDSLGYSVIKTPGLNYLEERNLNHPG